MKYRCRTIKPAESRWEDVEAASVGDAAQDFLLRNTSDSRTLVPTLTFVNEEQHRIRFALVEIEEAAEVTVVVTQLVVRNYSSGLRRKGGVKRAGDVPLTIEQIAKQLDWTKDPQILLASGWDGEEEDWK